MMRALARTAMFGGLGIALALPSAGAAHAVHVSVPGTEAAHAVHISTATSHWTATWTAGPTAAMPSGLSHNGLTDRTIRNVVYSSIGGSTLRVRLTNRYGVRPVTFEQVTVGHAAGPDATAVAPVTFGGATSVTIPVGGDVASDPVRLRVGRDQALAVSLFSATATGPATYHNAAHTTSYLAAGDHAADGAGTAFTDRTRSWFFLDGVDVLAAPHVGAIVALGDSITDGTGTAVDSNTRWTNDLFARIAAGPPGRLEAVTNSGIGGNEVTLDRQPPLYGPSARHRLDADVLDQPGVTLVLVSEGINDLKAGEVPAGRVIAGLRDIADRIHAAGLKAVGFTITPCGGYSRCGAGPLAQRALVNDWIRTSGTFDAVVDFDAVVRDPAATDRLLPAYDSGDHLHPDAAAYQRMADAIDLTALNHLVTRPRD
ncbi:SGNH/GDSL hydrolase family protein [Actinacidiphila acidipaludis]|uniref:SGNH/GDSL hydrolase family protein n=1 Tax=Actinacidiphila acidipaludis TaxID=2873382 RepID=A0ABS7QHC9_9ACTN|nr:SGNH/GDSL hydrolase family protein [Streptomyces acidipaludis]MBY8882567.1 SGNH/GDSL hydrolase family protein [Streptomyces acidipaludis]